MKVSRIFFVSILACMLLIPIASMTATAPSVGLSAPIERRSAPAEDSDFDRIGAIEGIVTQIDPEGSVRNAIGSFQNASYYGISYTAAYQAAAEGQMATDTGYVAACQLEMAGRSVYPTGRVGDAFIMLTILVNPIIVLPASPAMWYLSEPTLEGAQVLADEFVALYETDLSVEFERLISMKQLSSLYFNSTYSSCDSYILQYVSFPSASDADTAMSAMRIRLSGLGGFMDLLDGTGWPIERTSFAESIFFDHKSEESAFAHPPGLNPIYMYPSTFSLYVRADASFPDYVEDVYTGILGIAGFDTPDYITDGVGNEAYSLKQHVGYTGDIESKMFQDLTINSISSIVAVTPTLLEINGVATDWDFVGKDFTFNSSSPISLPTGGSIAGDSTADEIIEAMMVSFPVSYAMGLNMSISMMDPNMFDMIIDNLWTYSGSFPDFRQEILDLDWSMVFTGMPYEELNQDALRMIMEQAGITPDSLMTQVNETLLEENPMQALVEAFIQTIDNYHLLDILENTTYSNPYAIEGFLNDYIDDISTFIANFTGVDLPSSYATKEAFAALIEDHFGLVLQGLWDAMADFTGDTTNIKAAVQAMIDPEHLSIETVPYFMANMYASAVSEYDYGMYINFALPDMGSMEPWDPQLLWLSSNDIVLTFDLDISSLDFEGPHCTIRKSVPERMTVGNNFTVTITVENIGDATAYDLKILDGISIGFNTDKQYYWNRATLASGETWAVTCTYSPEVIGTFVEVPAILCYFNATLASFEPGDMENWDGAAMYTLSAVFSDRRVEVEQWWEGTILGIPTIIIIAGGIGAAILVIVIIVKKRA
ncbi:hypothetical protein E4H12_07910 [Candidatus Thorarchaeota archaeon]|nr:MAG: hypothetical protein E4H12_07910 [Candidatus Thorarchaeota archaeon]